MEQDLGAERVKTRTLTAEEILRQKKEAYQNVQLLKFEIQRLKKMLANQQQVRSHLFVFSILTSLSDESRT